MAGRNPALHRAWTDRRRSCINGILSTARPIWFVLVQMRPDDGFLGSESGQTQRDVASKRPLPPLPSPADLPIDWASCFGPPPHACADQTRPAAMPARRSKLSCMPHPDLHAGPAFSSQTQMEHLRDRKLWCAIPYHESCVCYIVFDD